MPCLDCTKTKDSQDRKAQKVNPTCEKPVRRKYEGGIELSSAVSGRHHAKHSSSLAAGAADTRCLGGAPHQMCLGGSHQHRGTQRILLSLDHARLPPTVSLPPPMGLGTKPLFRFWVIFFFGLFLLIVKRFIHQDVSGSGFDELNLNNIHF